MSILSWKILKYGTPWKGNIKVLLEWSTHNLKLWKEILRLCRWRKVCNDLLHENNEDQQQNVNEDQQQNVISWREDEQCLNCWEDIVLFDAEVWLCRLLHWGVKRYRWVIAWRIAPYWCMNKRWTEIQLLMSRRWTLLLLFFPILEEGVEVEVNVEEIEETEMEVAAKMVAEFLEPMMTMAKTTGEILTNSR